MLAGVTTDSPTPSKKRIANSCDVGSGGDPPLQAALVQNGPGVEDDGQMPRFVPIEELFKGRHFNQEIVILCVRWYLSCKLSFRDLVARMAERGIGMAHTILR